MSAPHCVVVGTGRMAGGFIVPLFRAAGWELTLVGRDEAIVRAINDGGGVWLSIGDEGGNDRWLDGVTAVTIDDANLGQLVGRTDLIATAVGPGALPAVGRWLAPLLGARLGASVDPLNIVTFENHRRAPELLIGGLLDADASLAGQIGRRIGVSGAVVWRIISQREMTNAGVRFAANAEDECYVDEVPLIPGVAPLDESVPGIEPARSFDDRMVEKLWLFNAGHCAAAYLGWHAGSETVDAAMARPEIDAAVTAVIGETQDALGAYLTNRPGSPPLPTRPLRTILDCYVDPMLRDPIPRVAREPRRKLAPEDRLIGPAIASLAAGIRPVALAATIAAALAYGEPTDPQASNLQQELRLVGPEEVLATVSGLHPRDELAQLVCNSYRTRVGQELAR